MSGRTATRLGTRGSPLATAQSRTIAAALSSATGREVELVEVPTLGDRSGRPLTDIGGAGVFVGALREALLEGRVDFAVHSLKDLPTAASPGLALAAVPAREDPRDALVARDGLVLGELPAGSTVGTGSPRRAAQVRALGLGLELVPIRGNVGTRLAMVTDGVLDAVLVARAGLARLGRLDAITEVLDPIQVLPAPGQGALGVECRQPGGARTGTASDRADTALLADLARLDDPDSRAAVTAERSLLAALEAGCLAPVGAHAEVAEGDDGDELFLRAVVVALDGSASVRLSATGPPGDAVGVGVRLAADLLAEGAADLMGERVP